MLAFFQSYQKTIVATLLIAGAVICLFVANFSQLYLEQSIYTTIEIRDYNRWPAPETLNWLAIGHPSVLADIIWLNALQYNDFYNRGHQIETYSNAILALDPNFEATYKWAALALLFSNGIDREGVLAANHYLALAAKRFPDNPFYTYQLGINWTSYYPAKDKADKREAREKGIRYLQQNLLIPGAPNATKYLLASLLMRNKSQARAVILEQLLLRESDPKVRKYLLRQLDRIDNGKRRSAIQNKGFAQQVWHRHHYPFLDLALAVTLTPVFENSL